MSFAAGSILASQIISPLVQLAGVARTFYLLAGFYSVLMVMASLYLALPEAATAAFASDNSKKLTASVLLKDVRFYGLWFMLFFNTTAGISLIAVAAPMAKDVIRVEEQAAIVFVGLIGLFNGIGRLAWSSLSDKMGRWKTFTSFFIIGAVCFLLLTQTTNIFLFEALVFLIISCYGGAFATMPAFIKDIYGADQLGSVFGLVLTAWAAAAFAGPWLVGATGSYVVVFYLFAGLLAFTTLISFLLKQKLTQTKPAIK
jgi:OFA family oxalate/formate antiporter-like MFS transporter